MKKFKSVINKSVVAVLFASVALALPSCGKNERELPEYADDKTMTLGAWGGPPLTQEGYDVFADAGFNCVFLDWRQMSASVFKDVMGYAENAGVKVWVQTGSENYDKPDILQKVYDADLDQYPAFDGINFYDEPARNQLEGIGKLVPKFEANYPNGLFTINLFPSYANPSLLGAGGFSGYVNDFVDNVLGKVSGRKMLSFDYYPLMVNNSDPDNPRNYVSDAWLSDLDIIANAARFTDIETHYFTQTRKFDNCRQLTSVADMRFQYAVGMSYGFKSASAFMYNAAARADGSWGEGLVCGDKINPEYYYAKEANAELHKFDHVYLSFDYLGTMPIYASSGTVCNGFVAIRNKLKEIEGVKSIEAEEPAIVGSFRDKEDNIGLMITNYTEPTDEISNTVTVKFDSGITKARVYCKGEPLDYRVKDGTLTLVLEPGEGVFVIAV